MAAPTSLAPVRDIFQAMRTEQINGHPLSDVVGGGDPELVASEVVTVIEKYANLTSSESILDVGCGCGRIAAALTQYIDRKSRYIGIDIVPGLIDFARNFITPRYPSFQFVLLNESNSSYDSWRRKDGEIGIAKLTEAVSAQSIDLAISVSVHAPGLCACSRDAGTNPQRRLWATKIVRQRSRDVAPEDSSVLTNLPWRLHYRRMSHSPRIPIAILNCRN